MLLTSILLLTGLILLVYASDRIVYGAAVFSRALGISPFITGILVAGPGTSLPELLTSAGAVLEGQPDLALGTIIGSKYYQFTADRRACRPYPPAECTVCGAAP